MEIKAFNKRESDAIELNCIGINSVLGLLPIVSQLSRYLDIQMSHHTNIIGKLGQHRLAVFTNYTPTKDEPDMPNQEIDLNDISLDIHYQLPELSSRYILVQGKNESINLLPKLKQLDYLFISNYPLSPKKEAMKSIEQINYIFDLPAIHLGKYLQQYFRNMLK